MTQHATPRFSFTARYTGTCGVCEDVIEIGDLCRYDAGVVVHLDCADLDRTVRLQPVEHSRGQSWPTGDPCPACFTIPAVSGACGCSE